MSKRDRELRKRKERERKVARAKIRKREEQAAALRKARFEEIRSLLAAEPAAAWDGAPDEEEGTVPGSGESAFDAERFTRYMWKAALEAGLDPYDLSDEEERDLVEDWEEKREAMLERDAVELAHEAALQALEVADAADETDDEEWEESRAIQLQLADEALKLDPGNVDALAIHGRLAFDQVEEEGYALLREAVRKGRESLGEEFFAAGGRPAVSGPDGKAVGKAGTRVEAKPFLRALETLAFHLDMDHRFEEALPLLLELEELGPPRPDALRRTLLDAGLCLGRTDIARRLLGEGADLYGKAVPWAWILVDLLEGRPDAAARSLPGALKACPAFPEAVLDDSPIDPARILEPLPEAHLAALPVTGLIGRAWRRAPGARDWLREAARTGDAPRGA